MPLMAKKLKVLYLTKYTRKGASSRLRSYQYFPYLETQGIVIKVSPLFDGQYLENLYTKKSVLKQIIKAYIRRFFVLGKVFKYDKVVIEKELFPYLPTWIEHSLKKLNIQYIVDYDDAIFHNYDKNRNSIVHFFLKHKIDKVMKYSQYVIVGNSYLKEKAVSSGVKNIQIIPTVIDLNRYSVKDKCNEGNIVIGWIGTNSTIKYVKKIVPVLEKLIANYNVRIHIVGAGESLELGENEIHIKWSEDSEVQSILTFDIGIMPLDDGDWEKGKCGYKLIQYMACAIPVVASAVGANKDIVEHGLNGFLVSEFNDWYTYMEQYIQNAALRKQHGQQGRFLVENKYCVQKQLNQYINVFKSV